MAKKAKASKTDVTATAKHAGGRPPMFATPEAMQTAIDAYFVEKTRDEKPFTVCGLALYIGFCSRQSLFEYGNKPEFTDIIKAAKSKIEEQLEENLHGPGCTGSIFNLKANYGWRDQHIELTGKDGKDLVPEVSDEETGRRLAFILAKAMNAQATPQPNDGDKPDED